LKQEVGESPIIRYGNSLLVYNPCAGKFGNGGSELIGRAVDILTRQGHNVTVTPTTGPGTAGSIAREAIGRGADLVLAAGGDGTVNEVVEGMVHSSVPLAVLPGGTANVLATEMKLGSRLERVAARLPDCRPRRVSVGQLTCAGGVTRYFLLMAGVGLDAQIVGRVDPRLKARTGKFAYWVAARPPPLLLRPVKQSSQLRRRFRDRPQRSSLRRPVRNGALPGRFHPALREVF
jgi:diacylglycerol kinase family enzyme